MMHKMLLDLLFFVTFVVLFMFGYGVATESIMYPEKRDDLDGQLVKFSNHLGIHNDHAISKNWNLF